MNSDKFVCNSLYLCTDSNINKEYDLAECVKQAILGGIKIVEVREKNKTIEEICIIVEDIKK